MSPQGIQIAEFLLLLLLGGILGAIGQGIRIIVGLKKVYDQALREAKEFGEVFDSRLLAMSILIGFVAGVLGVLGLSDFKNLLITKETIITLLGIGYAGADFIEGFMKKYLPGSSADGAGGGGDSEAQGTQGAQEVQEAQGTGGSAAPVASGTSGGSGTQSPTASGAP